MDILKLIPQRPPFVFVDRIYDITDTFFRSEFLIHEESLMTRNGYLTEAGLIEHVAQSMAAYIGWYNQDNVRIGVVASVANFRFSALPLCGDNLKTEITILNKVFDISHVKSITYKGDEIIAEGEMKLVERV
ncbi:MAG: hydroxymyristoyl-ACP dehydratase [Bacteroidales bacterium]|nr:hydroxymyristoyl-ACP dehydratase [Bacteroidales bacterium]